MAEGVAAGRLPYTGLEDSPLHRLLNHARIEMVAALGTGFPVVPVVLLGEDPLPRPFTLRLRILLRAIEMGGLKARPMAAMKRGGNSPQPLQPRCRAATRAVAAAATAGGL